MMPGVRRVSRAWLKLCVIRGCGFIAAGMFCLICAAMATVFAVATVHGIRTGEEAWPFLAIVAIFTGVVAYVFGRMAVSTLRYLPHFPGGDENPPPHGVGVTANLGPRGPRPLVTHAKAA
jgi:hypothetical protein